MRNARYALARLWLDSPDPETLLLDEPFSALDPILRRSLQDQFLALVGAFQKTAVFVTHDFAEAVCLADRIAVMAEGRIVQLGTPRELVFHPSSSHVAGFATPEIRRSLMCATDIAAGREQVGLREASSACLLGDAPLADVVGRLRREDICLHIKGADDQTIGWIDRDVQLDAAADAMEEFCAVPSFQRRDRGAYRRLGDIERLCGARDMLAFCDGDEDTKLFERHRLDVIRLPSSAAIRRPPPGPPKSPSAPDHHIGIPSVRRGRRVS